MKRFIPLIALLFLMPPVIASTLFDDYIDDDTTFNAGAHSFYVKYVESVKKLNFKMDGIGGMLLAGECETRDDIKYCFEEASLPQVKVKIISLEPDISIERSFSTISPVINGMITVTVKLKNNGDKTATNIHYLDIYPQGLKVFSDKNAGEWQGSLAAGEEEQFVYTIRAQDIVSFESIATLSYKFGDNEKTKKSSAIMINVQKPFNVDSIISKEAADKNEIIDYNLTITNNDESSRLSIENLEILLPLQIDLVDASSTLKREENKLIFEGIIEKKESKDFTVKVKSPRVGIFTIKLSLDVKLADKSFKEEIEKSFSIGISSIMPILNISQTIKSNSPYNIYIGVRNYGKEEIKNVNVDIGSDLFGNLKEKKDIKASDTYEILKKTLTAPYSEEDKKYNIKVSGSYISSSGKIYTFEKSAQVTVIGAPKIIQIIRELNKEEFYLGDKIEVKLKIKSQKNVIIKEIDVTDIFPKEIRSSLQGNITGFLEQITPNEEKEIYSYSLVIPLNYTKDEIEFKTTLNAKMDGELTILKRIDKIKVLKGEKPQEIQEEQKQETKEEPTQKEEKHEIKKKESFFGKIIGWVRNLFKKK